MVAFQYLKNKLSFFFKEILWDDEQLPSGNKKMRFILRPLRVAVMVSKGFYRHECFARATALTYATILSMIPLLAVAFAILSFFAVEHASSIENYLQGFFSPTSSLSNNGAIANEKANQFAQSVLGFAKNVNTKHITIVGFVLLVLSAISLISNIEYSFNHIWGIKRGRSFLRKLGSYSVVLIAMPFIIVISLALSTNYQTYALNATSDIESLLKGFKGHFYIIDVMIHISSFAIHHLGVALSHLLQFLFAWLLFAVLYYYLPYTKVKMYYSLKGGLVTAILFEVAKPLFVGYVKYIFVSTNVSKIYGALSFIPVSFLWIYIVWTIVLLGAELTNAFQNVKAYQNEFRWKQLNRKSKDLIVLKIFKEMLLHQQKGHYFTIEELASRFNVPFYFADESISLLVVGGILTENPDTGRLKILNEQITPGKVMLSMYHAGKIDGSELKNISKELETQLNEWEDILLSKPSHFEV